jgi:CRP/FNR family transcriptional regulator, cyclic AMP receptor protein
VPKGKNLGSFDVLGFLTERSPRGTLSNYRAGQILYSQGDRADSVFYIHEGKVKVTVVSADGKEAVIAIRGPDEFCGESAMTGSR